MRRLAVALGGGAAALVVTSFVQHLGQRHMAADPIRDVSGGPELAARVVVSALLRSDQAAATAWSTLDLSGGARSAHDPRDLIISDYVLRRTARAAVVAVEITGPDSIVSAVTLQAALVNGTWRIVGVAP